MFSFTDQQLMVYSGQATLWLLIIILAARPVHKYLKFKYLMKYRRQLGWAATGTTILHLSFWVVYYFSTKVLATSLSTLWFWSGLLSLLILLALGITSNNWSVKRLGGLKWKKLHKLTYLLPALSLVHAHYALRGINWELILYLIPLMLLVAWRFRETMALAVMSSMILGVVYYTFSGIEQAPEFSEQEIVAIEEDDGTFFIGSTKARLGEFDIELVCDRIIEESVSCGWPIYLENGDRIDNKKDLARYRNGDSPSVSVSQPS